MAVTWMLRLFKLLLAIAWAGALVVVGALVWPIDPIAGTCVLAAGQCVAMWLIADDLFPDAMPAITTYLKLTAALIFLTHLATLAYLYYTPM